MKTPDPKLTAIILALTESQDELHRYIFLRLGNDDAARDVLQETNLAILKDIDRLDAPENFLPWAKTLASLEIRHYLTDRKRENAKLVFDSETVETLAETLRAPEAEAAKYDEVDFKALNACIAKLPPEKRRLVNLRYWDDKTVESIAREDAAPFSTVAVRLLRIRKELSACIRRFLCRIGRDKDSGPAPGEAPRAELIGRILDGDLSRMPEMCAKLRRDPEFRREWFITAAIHLALVADAKRQPAAVQPAEPASRRDSLRFIMRLAASLTLIAFGVSAGILFAVWKIAAPAAIPAGTAQPAAAAVGIPAVSAAAAPATVPAADSSSAATVAVTDAAVTAAAPVTEVLTNAAAPIRAAALPTGEKEMNATTRATAALLVAAATVGLPASRTLADGSAEAWPVSYCANKPRYWQTAFTNEIPIRWSWCPAAGAASLVVKGMNSAYPEAVFTTNATAAAFSWFLPASADEDFYTLTLTFLDQEGGDTLSVLTGYVARVNGTSSGPSVTGVTFDTTSAAEQTPVASWPRLKRPKATAENVLIGYKASWAVTGTVAAATLSIQRQGNSDITSYQLDPSEGWFAWEVKGSSWGYGWFDLLLDFNGEGSLSGKAYRPASGTIFKFMGIQ